MCKVQWHVNIVKSSLYSHVLTSAMCVPVECDGSGVLGAGQCPVADGLHGGEAAPAGHRLRHVSIHTCSIKHPDGI